MKHLIFFFLIAISIPGWSQITTDSIIGTWEYVDKDGQAQQLVITDANVTVIARVPVYPENTTWITSTYSGPYTIIDGKVLHVIYNDEPREESFYHIIFWDVAKLGKRAINTRGDVAVADHNFFTGLADNETI